MRVIQVITNMIKVYHGQKDTIRIGRHKNGVHRFRLSTTIYLYFCSVSSIPNDMLRFYLSRSRLLLHLIQCLFLSLDLPLFASH